ncbi:MAG: helix-turn-helix transcriptional regulator [Leucobacter sp.]
MDVTQSIDGERLIAVFTAVVEQLGLTLPKSYEIVLHDLSKLPNSIVAISGEVTRRSVGDPATDLLLKQAASGKFENRHAYDTRLSDGRKLRSSTMIIQDVSGNPVAALCTNADLTLWDQLQDVTDRVIATIGVSPQKTARSEEVASPANIDLRTNGPGHEAFVHDVDELASHLINSSIQNVGVPVDLMQKQHKVEIVRDLKSRGLFMLKDAVQLVATELGVTRFTIYNYLNQLAEENELLEQTESPKGTSNE